MESAELIEIIATGEDSTHQFKGDARNGKQLATEMIAFANTRGGQILIGVNDDGTITGITAEDMRRLSNLVSNAASDQVRPPVNPITENISFPEGLVKVVTIQEGFSKPYMDVDGAIWVKCGDDKRKVTSREEIQRMYQDAGLFHGDELPVPGSSVSDVDRSYLEDFFSREYGEKTEEQTISLPQILSNMNLYRKDTLNLAGMLLFGQSPQQKLPVFLVKAVCYGGDEVGENSYIDSRDIPGRIADIFQKTISFILANVGTVQNNRGVNSTGEPEIPRIVFEELVANALVHRDYLISAPVRIFIFRNRIEIISPGHLPNNLTVENIKSGNSNIRNPILASYAAKILPYRGLGNGIIRALKAWPDIEFIDDREGNQFTVRILRSTRT